MSLPLREPFFLRGRQLPMERAVIMSLVIGGLGLVAGWLVLFAVAANGPGQFEIVMGVVWSATSAALVYGPLNFWNRRPWWVTLATIPVSFASIYLLARWLAPLTEPGRRGSWEFAIGFLPVLIVNGALLVRRSRLHVMAWIAFVLGGSIPIATAMLISIPPNVPVMSGMPDVYQKGFVLAAVFGNWYVALLALWGVPFWWPPGNDAAAET